MLAVQIHTSSASSWLFSATEGQQCRGSSCYSKPLTHDVIVACRWGILPKQKEPDTAIVNVYDVDDCIPPHIDHHDFDRPFCTISLLSQQNIMFGSKIISRGPGDFVCDYELPLPTGR